MFCYEAAGTLRFQDWNLTNSFCQPLIESVFSQPFKIALDSKTNQLSDEQGATASLADDKETSVDAAEAASLSESDAGL